MDGGFNYLTLISVCLLGAMSPGPSLMVILGVGSEYGPRAGVISSWSHALGVGLWAALSVSAWYLLTDTQSALSEMISASVLLVASSYLIYVGLSMCRQLFTDEPSGDDHSSSSDETVSHQSRSSARLSASRAGLSIAVANPKLLLFFSAIYPQVLPKMLSPVECLIAISVPILIDGLWYHLITLFSDRLGLLSALQRYRKVTQGLMAALLLMIGVNSLIAYFFV